MNPVKQVAQVNHFMSVIAPVITGHTMAQLKVDSDVRELADINAQLTLRFAVHLAAQFATFSDEALKATQAKNSAKAQFQADPAIQREAAPAGTGL